MESTPPRTRGVGLTEKSSRKPEELFVGSAGRPARIRSPRKFVVQGGSLRPLYQNLPALCVHRGARQKVELRIPPVLVSPEGWLNFGQPPGREGGGAGRLVVS